MVPDLCMRQLQAGAATSQAVQGVSHASSPPLLVKWLCLCLGRLIDDQPELLSQVSGLQRRPCIITRRKGSAML
jgi:hypothetical protein